MKYIDWGVFYSDTEPPEPLIRVAWNPHTVGHYRFDSGNYILNSKEIRPIIFAHPEVK